MKQLSILTMAAVLGIALIACSGTDDGRRNATSVGSDGWVFEGWSCAPNTNEALKGNSPAEYCDGEDNNYLYLKFTARASARAIARNSVAMKQSTCRRAARDQVAGDGLSKILGDAIEQASGVVDGESTGHAIIAQSQGLVRGVGIYNCCSLNNRSGKCAKAEEAETWEECQCVGYMKFPGGQDAFESAVEKITSEQ